DAVQLGELLRADLAGAHREGRDLVREEELEEQDDAGDDQHHRQAARGHEGDQGRDERHGQRADEEHDEDHAGGQSPVWREPRPGHGCCRPSETVCGAGEPTVAGDRHGSVDRAGSACLSRTTACRAGKFPARTTPRTACECADAARLPRRATASRGRRSAWDQTVAGEQVAHFVERGVRARQDEVARLDLLDRQRLTQLPHPGEQRVHGCAELGLLTVADGGHQLVIELVQLVEGALLQGQLPFAEDADDHLESPSLTSSASWTAPGLATPEAPASSCLVGPPASSSFIRSSSLSTPVPLDSRLSSTSMSSPVVSAASGSSSAPVAVSSVIASARACSCAVLSCARWMAMPTSPISSEMPVSVSAIRVCAWAAV